MARTSEPFDINEILWVQRGNAGDLVLVETTAPSTIPGSGQLYVKSSDSNLYFKNDSGVEYQLTPPGSGSGTVTSVSVASANGLAGVSDGNPATPTLTLSTTVTGILEGNGTAISAASTTGSGAVVLANTPTLITPVIGVATGTSLALSSALSLEETGAGTDTITIQAPAVIGASYTLTLPVDDGNSGEFLQTNGSGVLSWAAGTGSGLSVLTFMGL